MLRVASHNLPHTWPLEFFRFWVGPSSQERRPKLEVVGVWVTFCGLRFEVAGVCVIFCGPRLEVAGVWVTFWGPRLEVAGVCVTFCGPRLLQSLLMGAEAALIAAGSTERTQRAELTDEAVTSMFMSQIAMISK